MSSAFGFPVRYLPPWIALGREPSVTGILQTKGDSLRPEGLSINSASACSERQPSTEFP